MKNKKNKKSFARRLIKITLSLVALIPLAIFSIVIACNVAIGNVTAERTYNNIKDVPKRDVCVVLGTTPYSKQSKTGNPYFNNRIKAAKELYKAGKIKTIIVSGDSSKYYDETRIMRKRLIEAGIPKNRIKTDAKGKSTIESMLQMKNRFKLEEFIVVSQSFQNERAIFIANHYGLDAIGYNADDINIKKGYRVYFRELFARVKVFIDIFKSEN